MTRQLASDFGIVPIDGFVKHKDLPALQRCASAWAKELWLMGQEVTPLSVDAAMNMPEWEPVKSITSLGYV